MSRFLPDRPDLAQLRHQAKDLHRAATAGESFALSRMREVSDQLTLAAAQLTVARAHGYASWRRLAAEVQRKTLIATGDTAALARLLADHPELAREQVSSCYQDDRDGTVLGYLAVARFHGATDHDRAGEIARVLIAAGAPVDGTSLIGAASYGETDLARVLIEAGANLEAVGSGMPEGVGTALAHAVEYGSTEVVDLLVAAGAVVHNLVEAAGAGDLRGFLTQDTSPAERARALRAAAVTGRLAVIDQILATGTAAGADLGGGVTPLHETAYHGKPAGVRHLLARGADPDRRDSTHHSTPLGWCRYRLAELTRYGEHHTHGHREVERLLAPLTRPG